MSEERNDLKYEGKGQASRLSIQHEVAGGPLGIFGEEAKKHDFNIGEVSTLILKALRQTFPDLNFRMRNSISKKEINEKLQSISEILGQSLFLKNASIKPDGGVIEVQGLDKIWHIILVGESKHQGNDVEKIRAGIKQGKNKDSDFMAAGNAIERVHKNILEFRNLMIDELHFPYVVFLQGSNFATETFYVRSPDGRDVKVEHDSGMLNRIDRVTAANYAAKINQNYCRNIKIKIGENLQTLQMPTLYFQCDPWTSDEMYNVMIEVALTSLDVLKENQKI